MMKSVISLIKYKIHPNTASLTASEWGHCTFHPAGAHSETSVSSFKVRLICTEWENVNTFDLSIQTIP